MERIEAFEAMLKAALEQSEAERQKMEALKAQGKEKSATYRQYLGNRLFYNQLFAMYRQYVGSVCGTDIDTGEDRY